MAPVRQPTNPRMVAHPIVSEMGDEVTPLPFMGPVSAQEAQRDPTWFRLLERFGFPTLVALGLAWAFVGYNRQVREDQAQSRREFADAVEKLTRAAADDRKEVRDHLQKQTSVLEQIKDQLRVRDRR